MEQPTSTNADQPTSPPRSDKSSDSEGRPVREKLKETRIDAKGTSDPAPGSDAYMNDASTNGAQGGNSTSGSDSERGRLRRKRSREDFEDDQEEAKHPEKKQERHTRKKSRDVTSPKDPDAEIPAKPTNTSVPPITENEDETMQSQENPRSQTSAADRQSTPEAVVSTKDVDSITSPKNKRTREQAEAAAEAGISLTADSKDSKPALKAEDERTSKRPRDGLDAQPAEEGAKGEVKIPPGSGFANASATSPFAALSPKPQTSTPTETNGKDQLQTSDSAFKSSGFGAFASSSASPFSASKAGSSSPFASTSSNKISSFASSKPAPTASTSSGFGALGNNSTGQSTFGSSSGSKSVFGGALGGSAFGSVGSTPNKLSSFASGTSASITGLTEKPTVFGAPAQKSKIASKEGEESEDGSEGDDNDESDESSDPERRPSQTLLQAQGPPETGEENEDAIWNGRAKLYTLAGEAGKKGWQERGTGPFKLNLSREPPTRARFVLRADGTHRLLLNAAVTSTMRFGDGEGEEPKDGKLLFTAPTASGEVESHLLKLKPERAIELWGVVDELKSRL